jgi:hypothetical protein
MRLSFLHPVTRRRVLRALTATEECGHGAHLLAHPESSDERLRVRALAHCPSRKVTVSVPAALLDPKGGGASPKPLAHSARRAGVAKQPVSAPLCLLGHCGGRYRYAPSQRKRRSARLRSLTVGEDGCRSEATQCRVGPDERHYMEVVAGRSDPRKGKRRGQRGPGQKARPEGGLARSQAGEGGAEATQCRVGPDERRHTEVPAGPQRPKDGEALRQGKT